MKVVLAIDSFKGSLSSAEAANVAERGIRKIYKDADVVKVSVADGGEGTLEALSSINGAKICSAKVSNPLGEKIKASYAIFPREDGSLCAGIEVAQAAGITLLKKLSPMKASTFGVGEIILSAYKKGARSFLIGLGGTATSDCGIGLLSALGAKFFDRNNKLINKFGGENLSEITRADFSGISQKILECDFEILCDVKNPLYGKNGAAYVYSPQKGANKEQVLTLDNGMKSYAKILKKTLGKDVSKLEGAGAAGGLGAMFLSVFNAKKSSGIDGVLEALGFSKKIKGADFVITGEGRLDYQSAMGKTPSGVAQMAADFGIPVIAVGGGLVDGSETLYNSGVSAMFGIPQYPMSLAEAIDKKMATKNLSVCVENIFRLIKSRETFFKK